MNIFERAARAKLRFATSIGLLSTEDLFDLPLIANNSRASLDKTARDVNTELKTFDDGFVETKPNPAKIELQLKLDLVKHVIEVKKAEASAAETRIKNEQRRQKLHEILARKQDANLEGMSEDEILKELEALQTA